MTTTLTLPEIEEQVHKLSGAEKYRLMEVLYADLQEESENESVIPAWHQAILDEREKSLAEGKTAFIPWAQAREEILQHFRA